MIDYFTGVHPDRCDTYRKKDGRDLLVCSFGGYHAGTLYAFLASFDVARSAAADGDAHWDYLVDTVDETEDACLRAGEPDPVPVTRSELGSHAFRDLDRDGVRDLAVEVTHYTERSAAATAAHCRAAKNAEKRAKPAPWLPMRRVRKDVVEFLFDGERFVPRKK